MYLLCVKLIFLMAIFDNIQTSLKIKYNKFIFIKKFAFNLLKILSSLFTYNKGKSLGSKFYNLINVSGIIDTLVLLQCRLHKLIRVSGILFMKVSSHYSFYSRINVSGISAISVS